MGGAFVAVANDSSAVWWNPAGLAEGPFLDAGFARTTTGAGSVPRHHASGFALGTPPLGISYYRLRITRIEPADPIAHERAGREDRRAGTVGSLSVSQLGATVLQTLIPGIHAGATLKYLRGRAIVAPDRPAATAGDLPGAGDELETGTESEFDLDVGVLAVAGAFRVGVTGRNLREADFGNVALPRQVRVGAAFDAAALGRTPLTVALDADVRTYATSTGDRRVIALGAERWFGARQIGVRAGGRLNTVGARARAVTVGGSWSPRPGVYLDGHAAGGDAVERGWGLAARISF